MTARGAQPLLDREPANVVPKSSCPSDPAPLGFPGFLVPLSSLKVICGAAFGEKLTSPDDLLIGDTVRLAPNRYSAPVLVEERVEGQTELIFGQLDVGRERVQGEYVKVVTLMTDSGGLRHARVLKTVGQNVFLLFSEDILPRAEYILIAEEFRTTGFEARKPGSEESLYASEVIPFCNYSVRDGLPSGVQRTER